MFAVTLTSTVCSFPIPPFYLEGSSAGAKMPVHFHYELHAL
jgi:hypothetical protein